ncbi:PAS domain S-box protein [Pelomonas sp. KK5]|uniref:PAS domain S-box protein n=1 Tax=Pelomonas sp. KK5 TaxID=1855730 RepID=UPI00097C4BF5|nr:PAS domain S-box protein [Pelomonas sp. KK5]
MSSSRRRPKLVSLGTATWDLSQAVPTLDPKLAAMLLEHNSSGIAVLDLDGYYIFLNREMCRFFHRPAEQLIGRHVSELIGEQSYALYAPLIPRLLAGEALHVEGWIDYPGGHGSEYLSEALVPYGPPGGPVECTVVFARDSTELKLREQQLTDKLAELQRAEALKSAIVDHALAALVSTDAGGAIVEFNPAAEAMFGRRRGEVLGRGVSELIIPERYREAHDGGMARMQQGGPGRVMGKRLELHALRADGSEFPIEMVLWRTDVHAETFYTASIIDVSERRNAAAQIERQREALRQSEKLTAMGSLLAGVAHELNNPLSIVMGRASLLEEKCAGHAELQADARRIHDAAERCGRIVRTFMNMARSRPSQRGPVGFNELVRAAVEMLGYGYRTHGIALELTLGEGLPPISADGDQIGQIVMNLLVNAQQALAGRDGPRRVQVQTGLEPRRDYREPRVWLRVADNGPGIAAAARERIFEPFFTTKAEGLGTGLGLSVSRSLARDHGGELALEREGQGGGASFRLSLPISGATAAAAESVPMPLMEEAGPPTLRVLVVDDEPEVAEVMRAMLESAGYEVATADSGLLALELLDTARFDAIVSDLRMPQMDGAALWREISERHPALARSIVFVTGDTLSPDAADFLKRSRCASLDKPFGKADLLERVAGITQRR